MRKKVLFMRKSGSVLAIFLVPFIAIGAATGAEPAVKFIGPGLVINDNNHDVQVRRVNGEDRKVYFSFRAPKSGNLTYFKTYNKGDTNYRGGDGGTMRVNIWPADDASPARPILTGTALSTGTHKFNFSGSNPPLSEEWVAVTLTPNEALTEGQLYFAEIENIDSDPVNNWFIVNHIAAMIPHEKVMRHEPLQDWCSLHRVGNTWYDISLTNDWYYGWPTYYLFPSAEYGYSDGTKFGGVRLEPGGYASWVYSLVSSVPIRERINIQEDMTIIGVEIHTAASTAGSMSVEILKNDVSMATKTITEDPPQYYESSIKNWNGYFNWYTIDLDPENYFSVSEGEVVDVKMTAIGSAVFKFACDNTGYTENLGLSIESTYGYSSAQRYYDGKWIDVSYWSYTKDDEFGSGHWRVILITKPISADFSPPAPPTGLRIIRENSSS